MLSEPHTVECACYTEAAFDWFSGSLLAIYLAMAVSALALTAALSALALMRM